MVNDRQYFSTKYLQYGVGPECNGSAWYNVQAM